MPKVTDEHRASRRDQILRAALACFEVQGFHATSMTDIIKKSGLSAGAIYLYFPGKRDIAAAVARGTMAARSADIQAVAEAAPVPPPSELVRRVAEGFEKGDVSPGVVVQLWGEAVTAPEFTDIALEAFRWLGGTLNNYLARWAEQEEIVPPDEVEDWARLTTPILVGLFQGFLLQSTLLPTFDLDTYLAGIAQFLA